MTTTIKQIRDQQINLIRSLIPASLSKSRFALFSRDGDFEAWAEKNPQAALRTFFVRDNHDDELPHQSDGVSEELETTITVTVAYPRDNRYGAKGESDAMDLIREDKHQIDGAIGTNGAANYVSGQNSSSAIGLEIESLENIWLVKLQFQISFRRAIT